MSVLEGKKILLTREQKNNKIFAAKLRRLGAIPVFCPLIQTESYECDPPYVNATDWVIFTSVNGVTYFLTQYPNFFTKQTCRIAVIGEKTKDACLKHGIPVHFQAAVYRANEMMQAFFRQYKEVSRIIHICGNLALSTIRLACQKQLVPYKAILVYRTNLRTLTYQEGTNIATVDYLTATSPSTVTGLIHAVTETPAVSHAFSLPIICIGPTTENAARKAGFTNTVLAEKYTIEGMIEMMKTYTERWNT